MGAPKDEVSSNVFTTLSLFLRLEPAVANAMSESTIMGISRLLQSHNECIRTPHAWGVTLGIVERCASSAQAHQRGFYALTGLLQMNSSVPEGPALHPDAFRPYLKAVLAYVSVIDTRRNTKPSSAPPEILTQAQLAKQPISIRAMNLLYGLFDGAPTITELKDDYNNREVHKTPLWEEYWSPVFNCWVRLSRDPRNEVRTHAMTLIQRALMSYRLKDFAFALRRLFFPYWKLSWSPSAVHNRKLLALLWKRLEFAAYNFCPRACCNTYIN